MEVMSAKKKLLRIIKQAFGKGDLKTPQHGERVKKKCIQLAGFQNSRCGDILSLKNKFGGYS